MVKGFFLPKPFDLANITTIEDEADNERVQKQWGNGLHFTMEHTKPKKRALRIVIEYLDALWILMLALAIAGVDRVMPGLVNSDGSPRTEMPTDNPHDFTIIPLSLVKKYFDRCKSTVSKVHDRDQLFWLKDRDGEERAAWAKFFRESEGLTFGLVINKNLAYAGRMLGPSCRWEEEYTSESRRSNIFRLDQLSQLFVVHGE